MLKLILAALLLGGHCFSQVIKDDVYVTGEQSFELKEACEFMGYKDFPLIDIKTTTQIDCMKAVVDAGEFCKKRLPADPYLSRGFIRKSSRKVICQSANKVIFKYLCQDQSKEYCKDSGIGCYEFKEKFAIRLEIIHHSLVDQTQGKKVLNCYFTAKNSDDLDKLIK